MAVDEVGGARRESEEACRRAFDSWLRQFRPGATIEWESGDEPPDFYLKLSGTRYAVEVALLMKHWQVGSRRLSDADVSNTLYRFGQQIEDKAKQLGILQGAYILHWHGPINRFGKLRAQIEKALLDYVQRTQCEPHFRGEEIQIEDTCICEIAKVDSGNAVLVKTGPNILITPDTMRDELCDVMEREIRDKEAKLAKSPWPVIVLLHDGYYLADPGIFHECTGRLRVGRQFDTIFIVRGNGGFPLFSSLFS